MSSPDIYQVLASKSVGETFCLVSSEKAMGQDKNQGFLLGRNYLVVRTNTLVKDVYTVDPDKIFAEVSDYFNKLTLQERDLPKNIQIAEKARFVVADTIRNYLRDESFNTITYRYVMQTMDWATGWRPLEESARIINSKIMQLNALADVLRDGKLATVETSPATFNAAAEKLTIRPLKVIYVAPSSRAPSASAPDPIYSETIPVPVANTPSISFSQLPLAEKIDVLDAVNQSGQLDSALKEELMSIYTEIWTERNFAGLVRNVSLARMQKLVEFFKIVENEGQSNWLNQKLSALPSR